jgi:DNA repair protein RecN (Recombination protein N)
MLAMNLVLTTSPPTLVFDEVDAGIGGDAANTVAKALGKLGLSRQVLVVTHLPQVAASAAQQVFVSKRVEGKMTIAEANTLSSNERIAEIARMLSGDAESKTALAHAKEIINAARARIEGRVS